MTNLEITIEIFGKLSTDNSPDSSDMKNSFQDSSIVLMVLILFVEECVLITHFVSQSFVIEED
jgi:hypothetical protein